MNRVDILLEQLKPKHGADFIFIAVGLVGLAIAFIMEMPFMHFLTVFGLGFGILMFFSINAKAKSFKVVSDNYQIDRTTALEELEKIIIKLQKAIDVDERKSHGTSKEARDSARDVIRKQARMDLYLELKNEIEN